MSRAVETKFIVRSRQPSGGGYEVNLDVSTEDSVYFEATPAGHVNLQLMTAEAAQFFGPGEVITVTFTKE